MNEVIKLIKNHRSIRKFQDKSIDDSLIQQIIEAAQCASSSTFVQAYSIIGIKNPEMKKKLAHFSGDQPYVESAPLFLVFCADMHRLDLACRLHDTEMVGDYTESFIMATVDAALAAQNTMVAAESLGLGGVYIGGIRNHPHEVSALLELPQFVYPVFGMCLGYPHQNPEIKPRLPMNIVYKEEKYNVLDEEMKIKQYDEKMEQYYIQRTKGKRSDTWTQQMAEKMHKETRPHMKEFLASKGFLLK
ncbi:oxygen-insensitive NADPH nitroreductase [Clostridiaceae bacterium 35-E11]